MSEHGTLYRERSGCDCMLCRSARRDWYAHRARAVAAGRWRPFAAAAPVRIHVQKLLVQGMSRRTIAARAGVAEGTVSSLLAGKRSRMRAEVADALLGVRLIREDGGRALFPVAPVRRRLAALQAQGWSMTELARRLDRRPTVLSHVMHSSAQVRAELYIAVRDLYEELWKLDGGSKYARTWARHHGYLPPQTWDEAELDDPRPIYHPAALRRQQGWRDGLAAEEQEDAS